MPKELAIAFPPSGNWLSYAGVPLNFQPPDLLMQLIEYVFVRDGMKPAADADYRPAHVLQQELMARLSEIKMTDDGQEGGG